MEASFAINNNSSTEVTQTTPRTEAITKEFSTPEKYYPVKSDGSVDSNSPSLKTRQNVIYVWKNTQDSKRLIGYTDDVQNRLGGYKQSFKKEQTALAQAYKDSPTDFQFGLLVTEEKLAEKGLVLDDKTDEWGQLETDFIKAKNSIKHGYNKRLGGGGGCARRKNETNEEKKARKKDEQERVIQRIEKLKEEYESPIKSFPLDEKTFAVKFSPETKKKKDVLYSIRQQKELTKTDGSIVKYVKRYIGMTEPPVARRFNSHCSYARHPEKRPHPQYKAMHDEPKTFRVKVYDCDKTEDLHVLEIAMIKFFRQGQDLNLEKIKDGSLSVDSLDSNHVYNAGVFNGNDGGGGGAAKKRPSKNIRQPVFPGDD